MILYTKLIRLAPQCHAFHLVIVTIYVAIRIVDWHHYGYTDKNNIGIIESDCMGENWDSKSGRNNRRVKLKA